jgi:hypothetical protein
MVTPLEDTIKPGTVHDNLDELRLLIACVSSEKDRRTKNVETRATFVHVACIKSSQATPCPFSVKAKPSKEEPGKWVVISSNTGHVCSMDQETKARKKSTPLTAAMLARPCLPHVNDNPQVPGSTLRTTIKAHLERLGLRNPDIPNRVEYRVRQECFRLLFGERTKWFHSLLPYETAFKAADPENYMEISKRVIRNPDDASTTNVYQRAFVCPAACQKFVSVLVDLRLVIMADCGHCPGPFSCGQLAMLSCYDAGERFSVACLP